MCGISGIYAFDDQPITSTQIEAQIATLHHRGPDESGLFVAPSRRCGLGIRRLSIIDMAGGSQPLSNKNNSLHLVFNGEIYNHRILRRELEQAGHHPKSQSDAEVILHGYEAWGAAGVLARLRGMFAFALWDEPRRRLFLARDRFGIKPLYLAHTQNRLIFGSEIKAILSQPNLPRRINLTALQAMLTVGFVPGPATMFEGIHKLPPAHFLLLQAGQLTQQRYWQLTYTPPDSLHPIKTNDAIARFRALLAEAVSLRLMSEVPLGALLSGGLDSGTLVALMQRQMTQQVQTVSIGFTAAAYNEAPLAQDVARFVGAKQHTITFSHQDFEYYPHLLHYLEEPQCAATAAPIYRLYQACRQAGLTVVFTGEGADELLGGYHWHRGDVHARRLLRLPSWLRRLAAGSPLPMTPAARRVLHGGAADVVQRYRQWLQVADEGLRPGLLSAEVQAELGKPADNPLLLNWVEKLAGAPANDPFHQLLWLEAQTRMVDFINFEVDKMSMANSVEARVPFLDHVLWEFCATLPAQLKLRGQTEKYLLREAAQGLLPEETRLRRKKGLAAPYVLWLRQPRLPEWAEEALSAEQIKAVGLFDDKTVQSLRRQQQGNRPQLGSLLMGVLSTQLWYNQFIDISP